MFHRSLKRAPVYHLFGNLNNEIKGVLLRGSFDNKDFDFLTYNYGFNPLEGYTTIYKLDKALEMIQYVAEKRPYVQILFVPKTYEKDWQKKKELALDALDYHLEDTEDITKVQTIIHRLHTEQRYNFYQTIPFNTKVIKNSRRYQTYRRKIREGQDGFREIAYDIREKKYLTLTNIPVKHAYIAIGTKKVPEFQELFIQSSPLQDVSLQYFNNISPSILSMCASFLKSDTYNVKVISAEMVCASYSDDSVELIGNRVRLDVSGLPVSKIYALERQFLPRMVDLLSNNLQQKHDFLDAVPIYCLKCSIEPEGIYLDFFVHVDDWSKSPTISYIQEYKSAAEFKQAIKDWKLYHQKGGYGEALLDLSEVQASLPVSLPVEDSKLIYFMFFEKLQILKISRSESWTHPLSRQFFDMDQANSDLMYLSILYQYVYAPVTDDENVNVFLLRCYKDWAKKICNSSSILKRREDLGEDYYQVLDVNYLNDFLKKCKQQLESLTYQELVKIRPKFKRKIFAQSEDKLGNHVYQIEKLLYRINLLDSVVQNCQLPLAIYSKEYR